MCNTAADGQWREPSNLVVATLLMANGGAQDRATPRVPHREAEYPRARTLPSHKRPLVPVAMYELHCWK